MRKSKNDVSLTWRLLLAFHVISVLLCVLSSARTVLALESEQQVREESSACQIEGCACRGKRLQCQGVNWKSFETFHRGNGENETWRQIVEEIHLSNVMTTSLNISFITSYPNLRDFIISDSKISIVHIDGLHSSSLKSLNLSSNAVKRFLPLEAAFSNLTSLKILDVSNNQIGDKSAEILKTLPESLIYLDISNNSWTCSPSLAWMHEWARPLRQNNVLKNINDTRCRFHGSATSHGPGLLLAMEYYVTRVTPECPSWLGCRCHLAWIQEGTTSITAERVYSVKLDCAGLGLTEFPKAPLHTREVDLSGNLLDDSSFSGFRVSALNYDEVEDLRLDDNLLPSLPEELLKMRGLHRRFSAKNNRLKDIPYDFSQKLIGATSAVELSGNPWMCVCSSQITDLILVNKIRDKANLRCGPDSVPPELVGERIEGLDSRLLCPPEVSSGQTQETLLRLLCLILAALTVAVLAKLALDYRDYRNRGQLPWIVLKMP